MHFSYALGPNLVRRTLIVDGKEKMPIGPYGGETSIALIPIAARISLGGEWFLKEYLSLGFDMGIGGGPMLKIKSNFFF